MKVLQINCVYGKGSTGKICEDIHNYLQQNNIDSYVIYGRGENRNLNQDHIIKVCGEYYSKINNAWSRICGIPYGGCSISTQRIIREINRINPDIVHLQCINGFFCNIYELVSWLNHNNYKTVLTLHAEFMYTGNCSHALSCEKWKSGCGKCERLKASTHSMLLDRTNASWKKMQDAFKGFRYLKIVAVSDWLKTRASESPFIGKYPICVIYNGLNENVFHFQDDCTYAKELINYKDIKKPIIFHATPNFSDNIYHIKGGYYVIELAKKMKEYQFVIAGPHNISGSIPDNVLLLGHISNQLILAQLYSIANLTLLTSKVETFSMVCAESLSCGTPIVGFKAGAPEKISIPEYSMFVDYGNEEQLKYAVEKMMINSLVKEDVSKHALEKYSSNNMANNYLELYSELLQEDVWENNHNR